VGVSVTNALAKRLAVSVWRDGQRADMAFAGGDVIEKLAVRKAAPGDRKHGTSVRVWPDAKYFESAEMPRQELVHLLRSKAVLLPGVERVAHGGKEWPTRGRKTDLEIRHRPARLPAADLARRPR
jgi:topoisomerase-4 subunit B